MGTNYYFEIEKCPHCATPKERLHIGKSSRGWTFSFHGIPELDINTWADWQAFIRKNQENRSYIVDEYGDTISLDKFIELVNSKVLEKFNHTKYAKEHHPEHAMRDCYLDPDGHAFMTCDFS